MRFIAITSSSISLKYQIIVGLRKELILVMFTRSTIIGKMEESSMEIKMAIETAKKDGNWSIVSNKPTSVAVVFIMPILKMKQSWTSTVRTLSPSW